MKEMEKIKKEYESAIKKKRELMERLRELEKTEPGRLGEIWRTRDQVAYWEGRAEGLKFAMEALERLAARQPS
jgi:hypothetical protein